MGTLATALESGLERTLERDIRLMYHAELLQRCIRLLQYGVKKSVNSNHWKKLTYHVVQVIRQFEIEV